MEKNEKTESIKSELNEDLLSSEELENVEGGDFCDAGCLVACLTTGIFKKKDKAAAAHVQA